MEKPADPRKPAKKPHKSVEQLAAEFVHQFVYEEYFRLLEERIASRRYSAEQESQWQVARLMLHNPRFLPGWLEQQAAEVVERELEDGLQRIKTLLGHKRRLLKNKGQVFLSKKDREDLNFDIKELERWINASKCLLYTPDTSQNR